jgi:cytochrome c biogenesis protein
MIFEGGSNPKSTAKENALSLAKIIDPPPLSRYLILRFCEDICMTKNNPEDNKKSLSPWYTFSSIKLTLFLLILLAATSIFGTVIPQQEGAMELAEKLSPTLVRLLSSLQLFDMYHSLWFRLIIGALVVNLIVCSVDRFPSSLKRFRSSPKPDRLKPFEDLPPGRSFPLNRQLSGVAEDAVHILRSKYSKVETKEGDEAAFLYAEKGRYAFFAVYLVHFSVLLILMGGIIGSLFGFEAFVNIPEGGTVDKVTLRKSGTSKPLPFTVRCEKFSVEFYPNGTPKEYLSDVAFFTAGKVALQGALRVNHPITFQGITFYQATYGSIPGDQVLLGLKKEGAGESISISAEVDKPFPLPGKAGEAVVTEARSDFMRMGPAVHMAVRPAEGKEIHFWIFRNYDMIKERFPGMFERFPTLNPGAFKPFIFRLEKMESKYYTGLQVSRDPGVPLVWAGFVSIMVGLFATFFLSHRMIWVQISKGKQGVTVSMAGMASKNPVGLERELNSLALLLRSRLGAKQP